MKKCRIILPVTLFDGTHPEDWDFIDAKFLVRETEMEEMPLEGSATTVVLADNKVGPYSLACTVADVTRIADENITQITLASKQLHVNWWRCGVASMFDHGWQWAKLQVVPPPQKPTY